MDYETLGHGKMRFTLADGSKWVFRKIGVRELALVVPIPVPKAALPNAEPEHPEQGPVIEAKPVAVVRGELVERAEQIAAILTATAVSPRIVPDNEEIAEGEDAAYLHEIGREATPIADAILEASGFGGKDLGPFPADGKRADA